MLAAISYRRWAAGLALIGVGLLVSLLPFSEYVIGSTGVPYTKLVPVKPGSGMRQQLGEIDDSILEAEIWIAAGKDAEAVHVEASIVRNGSETVRQFSTRAEPAVKPRLTALHFEPYKTASGDRFELEVAVRPNQANWVMFGIARSESPFTQVTVNGDPLDFEGPLAYTLRGMRHGFEAALSGAPAESVRLYGGLAFLGLSIGAALLGPTVSATLRRLARRFPSGAIGGGVRRPYFYPWLVALYPILYFYSNNVLVFAFVEFLLAVLVTLTLVTAVVLILRLATGGFERAALITVIGSTAFLTYGYIESALGEDVNAQVLLPIAVGLTMALCLWTWNRRTFAVSVGRFLNPASVVLILMPIIINADSFTALFAGHERGTQRPTDSIISLPDLENAALHPDIRDPNTLPDIYYIVLDAYNRADLMRSQDNFDNSAFLDALADRGFYVPPAAVSNYPGTLLSLASSLNFTYLSEVGVSSGSGIPRILRSHAIGSALKAFGYLYVHLNSGFWFTNNMPGADQAIDFYPEGPVVLEPRANSGVSRLLSRRETSRQFIREFLRQTTMLAPILPPLPVTSKDNFDWRAPQRTLATFAYLEAVPRMPKPTFTVAHILKPHGPYVFDQFGNMTFPWGWDDDHDPTVPGAYYGQVLYTNKLVLRLVDKIIADSESPPVIIITADHAEHEPKRGLNRHKIFAAYHLPHGGNDLLYPSISSVNTFRVLLDYYFGLDLGLLDDNIYLYIEGGDFTEFEESPITLNKN